MIYRPGQLASLLGVTERALRERARSEGWPTVGQRPVCWALADLPRAVQEAVQAAQGSQDLQACPALAPIPAAAGPAPGHTDRADRRALDRYRLAESFQAALAHAPRGDKGEAAQAWLLAYHAGSLHPDIFARLGRVSQASLYNWMARLKRDAGDYTSLRARAPRRQGMQLTAQQQLQLLRGWLHPNQPSMRLAWRMACHVLPEDARPSYDQAYRYLTAYEQTNRHVVLLARQGEKALKDLALPYITRDGDALAVGDVLVGDGHTLNFMIRHPRTGRPSRMTLLLLYDWASRYPLGWQIMPTENTVAVAAALRMACHALGRTPLALLLDNGKAFKAKVFTSTDPDLGDFRGLFARLGIRVHYAAPYNARAKVIERFFGTLQEQFETLMPSYCGNAIATKPAWMHRNEAYHRQWRELRDANWLPTVHEAGRALHAWIAWYAATPHDGLDGRTPRDLFEAGRSPEPHAILAELDREFLWRATCTPRNCRVQLHGITYESPALLGVAGKVEVYYDTANLGVVDLAWRGRSLGQATPVEALHPLVGLLEDGEASLALVKDALKTQRRLASQTKQGLAQALGETGADLAAALDWTPARPVPAALPAAPAAVSAAGPLPAPSMGGQGEQTTRRLRALAQASLPHEAVVDQAPRPDFFLSDVSRYEWVFRATLAGQAIPDADRAWAAAWETGETYALHRQRFEDLRRILVATPARQAAA